MQAEIRTPHGVAEIYLGGKPASRTLARAGYPGWMAVDKLRQYREAHIDLYMTSIFEPNMFCWDGVDGYDYEVYETHIRQLVEAKPDIRLIPFVGGRQGSPYLWCKNNQEELVLDHRGRRIKLGSPGSKKWRDDSLEAVRRFVEHFENSELAENIVGYQPILIDNEWRLRIDGTGGYADFSQPTRRAFREWLRGHYGGDVEALRTAWRDAEVSFESVQVPSVEDREAAGRGGMFDFIEQQGARIADYYRAMSEITADLVIDYCRTIKETTGGSKLTLLMYGYSYCGPYHLSSPHTSTCMAARRVYASPWVDGFHSPYHYFNRSVSGVHYSQQTPDSIRLHGKALLAQIDTKTHVHPPPNTNARTPYESEQILKRDVGHAIAKNCHHYWYEMAVPTFRGQNGPAEWRDLTYDPQEIRELIGRLQRVADRAAATRPTSTSEVAFVSTQTGEFYRKMEQAYGNFFVEGLRQFLLPYVGAPFDDFLLEDMPDFDQAYKLYLFPNAFYMSADLRRKIREKLQRDGATALWFFAPGYVDDSGAGPDRTRDLTGLTLGQAGSAPDFLHIELTRSDHPLLAGVEVDSFGSDMDPNWFQAHQEWAPWFSLNREDYRWSPKFFVTDEDAAVLGTHRGTDLPALAVKEVGRAKSVYCGAPMPPLKLLTNLMDDAGVHRYARTNDLIYANSTHVIFCVRGGDGPRTLHLPAPADVVDAMTDEVVAKAATEVNFDAKDLETRIFRLEQ
ncbi:MAG: beta-galactosidase [Phycisphaeraceae bacterium]